MQGGDGDQAIGRQRDQQVHAQPGVVGVGHELPLGKDRGQAAGGRGGGQQQQLQAVYADHQAFQPEHHHAQPDGGGQGQGPSNEQMLGAQHRLLQPDSMENQGSQQAQTGDLARLLHAARAGQADPKRPPEHCVRQGSRRVKYNA
ncbi:hypothetical protein D9M68_750700 [compost metagenome]